MALGVPAVVGSILDPLLGALADTRLRRRVLLAGGAAFAVAVALTAAAVGFWMLLAALVLWYSASGAFVGLAQATLVDLRANGRERAMALWTLAGSAGYVAGPLLVLAAVATGSGWRLPLAVLAVAALACLVAARRLPPHDAAAPSLRSALAGVADALRSREVLRWLAVSEAANLLVDVFHGFLALYVVDVAGGSPATGALAVAVWTGAGLAGDALLVVALARIDGVALLRATALASLVAYPSFLLVPGETAKLAAAAALGLLNSGWYAIPQGRLYDALPGRSGAAVAAGGLGGLAGALVPAGLGLAASAIGLGPTLWLLLAAPVVLLVLLPSRSSQM